MFDSFFGNAPVVASLRSMLAEQRLPQTLLFSGPRGVGKATLARLLAAALNCAARSADPCGRCSHCRRILEADLALPHFQKLFEERARLTLDKRRDNPLVVSTHPEFLCFPPDGPLPQVSIEQARRLKEHAQFGPSDGRARIFLVDGADQMDLPAANSLLKILEEPPPSLTVILTAENAYELLPTIRSRCVPFWFASLSDQEMQQFVAGHSRLAGADQARLLAWAQGSPGQALAIDVPAHLKRRQAMLALLRVAAGSGNFAGLIAHTEAIGRNKQEKLELLLEALYELLSDLLRLRVNPAGGPLVHEDLRSELARLAAGIDLEWLDQVWAQAEELHSLARRNIQKQIALEALAVSLASGRAAPGRLSG